MCPPLYLNFEFMGFVPVDYESGSNSCSNVCETYFSGFCSWFITNVYFWFLITHNQQLSALAPSHNPITHHTSASVLVFTVHPEL